MITAVSPSVGINRWTGGTIDGFDHVIKSLGDIYSTPFGMRIMREWYGSNVPALLGRNIVPREIVSYFVELLAPVEQWEPRFRTKQITPLSASRTGHFSFSMEGEYRPRACFGDFTVEGARKIYGNLVGDGRTILGRSA